MPILIKSKPRYRCQFCRYSATSPTIEKHEKRCWKNPDRFCDNCQNTGEVKFWLMGAGGHYGEATETCHYCAKRHKDDPLGLLTSPRD